MSSNNEKDDKLTVSRLYDTLKSPNFLKNLYWDILSDIKEKNTYKLMRELAEGVIDQNMEVLNGLSNNSEEDDIRRQAIVAEISVMSYTIDKIFSKVLYMKLEKACKEQIIKIIQELKDEGKISESVWSKFKLNADNSGSQTSTENTVVNGNSVQPKKDVQKVPTRVGKRRRKAVSNYNIYPDIKKTNSNKEILDDLKKVNSMKYTNEDKDSVLNRKENFEYKLLEECPKVLENKNTSKPGTSSPKKKLSKKNTSLLQNSSDKTPEYNIDNTEIDDSDKESEISFGRMSITSDVSSVHTSDLSSFDDEISLSSDDESGGKRRISLKDVMKRLSGKFPLDDCNIENENDEPSKSSDSKVSVNTTKKLTQDTSSELPSENGLSKRARKPNSKYSSDNILCPPVKVKERKKSIAPIKTIEKNIPSEESLPQKKAKVDDDIYVDVVTITQSINEGSPDNIMKTPAKQPESSELFKSRSASRSLTSRRTAPLTLFST